MAQTFGSLRDVLVAELGDMLSAEQQVMEAMPMMIEAATSPRLKESFRRHMTQTEGQITRLNKAFSLLGLKPEAETCDGMKGILKDGAKTIAAKGDPAAKDAALIAAAQKVEHYEIASYGTLRTFAQTLGLTEIADLMQTTLTQESQTDELLTSLAEASINRKAA